MPRNMYAQVIVDTEGHGPIDVEFKITKFADIDVLIENGFMLEAVRSVTVIPEGLAIGDLSHNATLESLVRRLDLVDDIKVEAIEGADRLLARSPQVEQLAEKQTDAQPRGKHNDTPDGANAFQGLVADWLGLMFNRPVPPLMGAG